MPGAPEFARAKRSETQSPVKQTIDTWSFGCVLSVAATWVILGFQGVRQFELQRKLANEELGRKDGRDSDRFHDGRDVLPKIKAWYRYLLNRIRKADTITESVSDLINGRMLQGIPDERLTSTKLCERLDELLYSAEEKRDKMLRDGSLSEVDRRVKRALLVAEKGAPSRLKVLSSKSASHSGPAQLDVSGPGMSNTLRVTLDPAAHQSTRIGKEQKLQRLPHARTPHREQILEEELGLNVKVFPVLPEHDTHPSDSSHGGATTHSPTDMYEPSYGEGGEATPVFPPTATSSSPPPAAPAQQDRPTQVPLLSVPVPPKKDEVVAEPVNESKAATQHDPLSTTSPREPEVSEVSPESLLNTNAPPQEQTTHRSSNILASDVYELPWEICAAHKTLKEGLPKGTMQRIRAQFTNWLRKENWKNTFYQYLANYIDGRDMESAALQSPTS